MLLLVVSSARSFGSFGLRLVVGARLMLLLLRRRGLLGVFVEVSVASDIHSLRLVTSGSRVLHRLAPGYSLLALRFHLLRARLEDVQVDRNEGEMVLVIQGLVMVRGWDQRCAGP